MTAYCAAVYMLFVAKELGFEPGVRGFIFAVGGVSSLVGSLSAGRSARRIGAGPTIVLGRMAPGAFDSDRRERAVASALCAVAV